MSHLRAADATARQGGVRARRRLAQAARVSVAVVAITLGAAGPVHAQAELPQLNQPVNDFAKILDPQSTADLDRMIRALDAATGDAVVVATVPNLDPYGDINAYAVKLFENHGRGIGRKGKDNGVLILVAPNDRKVWVEVGYDLEQWITDGFSGETSREFMAPRFRQGEYGAGVVAGTERIIGRIAQGRGVSIEGIRAPSRSRQPSGGSLPWWVPLAIFIFIILVSRAGGGPGRRTRYWGGGGWSGWSSGVGPFGGGGWSSRGGGGGGFGGGFGGFGGGRSGGGGGGASW